MTREQEIFYKIQPLLNGRTEGLFWDFKQTIDDTAAIIKDILAFSNSSYKGDSYIIVGVSENYGEKGLKKIKLSMQDKIRLGTQDNYLYTPKKWDIRGLGQNGIDKMKQFSITIMQKLTAYMLISQPEIECLPLPIKKTRWLYVIIIKHKPGVFISKQDIADDRSHGSNIIVKQGALYIRVTDTTIGHEVSAIAPSGEHIRVWQEYIEHLRGGGDPTHAIQEVL